MGNSRHVDIRYFFVKDRVDKGEIGIEYCPTESMLADFFTKPLQGALFHKFRKVIMGYAPISSLQSPVEERVENTIPSKRPAPTVETRDVLARIDKTTKGKNKEEVVNSYAEVLR